MKGADADTALELLTAQLHRGAYATATIDDDDLARKGTSGPTTQPDPEIHTATTTPATNTPIAKDLLMGSPAAAIYFGYDLGHLHKSVLPPWWFDGESDDGDWEYELVTRLGGTWPDRPTRTPGQSHDSPAYQHYQANLDRCTALLESLPVELVPYGFVENHSDAAWSIRASTSVRTVEDAYQTTLLEPLDTDPAWTQHLTRFAELLELPLPATAPGWYLNCTFHP